MYYLHPFSLPKHSMHNENRLITNIPYSVPHEYSTALCSHDKISPHPYLIS